MLEGLFSRYQTTSEISNYMKNTIRGAASKAIKVTVNHIHYKRFPNVIHPTNQTTGGTNN